jgi:hypothetical protein
MEQMDHLLLQHNYYDRARNLTADKVNYKLDKHIERALRGVLVQGPEAIEERLNEIDKEWDLDRILMLNFGVLVFAQLLAARKDRRWLWGPLFQTPFMVMHATLGWCPPSLWFRPMGFRTKFEIRAERDILVKALERMRSAS